MSNALVQKRKVLLVLRQTEADYKRLGKIARRENTKKATLASAIISQWLADNETTKPQKGKGRAETA